MHAPEQYINFLWVKKTSFHPKHPEADQNFQVTHLSNCPIKDKSKIAWGSGCRYWAPDSLSTELELRISTVTRIPDSFG